MTVGRMKGRWWVWLLWVLGIFSILAVLTVLAIRMWDRTSVELNDGGTTIVSAHMDDELLWFEPLLVDAHSIVQAVMPIGPAHLRARNAAYGDYKGSNLLDKISHAFVPFEQGEAFFQAVVAPATDPDVSKRCRRDRRFGLEPTKQRLAPIIERAVAQGAKRLVTHNPWGEYGHPQHRMLSRAVRELALERFNIDVWVLATVVMRGEQGRFEHYVDLRNLPDIEYAYLEFDAKSIRKTREAFKQQLFFNTQIDTWTWGEGEEDFPTGRRPYIRLVAGNPQGRAVDMMAESPRLARRIRELLGGPDADDEGTKAALLYQDCTIPEDSN